MQQDRNKSHGLGKSNTWVNSNLAKTMAALDEFKCGFPSDGLSTVTNKWWGSSTTGKDASKDQVEASEGTHQLDTNEDAKIVDNDMKQEDGNVNEEGASERPEPLVAVRKRIAEEGREAVKLGLHRGFGSKKLKRRDQALLSQIFSSSLPKDQGTGSS
ncbi:PREDICTED: uncharacterized protein LOC104800828 [Tarenaya hassleriana]|uniref:uncharacterized protein LOC104800828 n=1 Tax=Tarenaya hassleriana TaxID=28532 RepID=UPI00053C5130|nr:PREDICTED: uncharacterized protein LOC104800828 [Tarenaya hassleriana]XP_010522077.1 PREDICTED: uncharacterized protein LOC104800828 [Tarenaya hassleriana]XP_019056476.1 PREDICTED: uncharacterized protein LOC104800828 [Tarenaya hassleriana]